MTPRSVLLVRFLALGDVLLTLPVVEALARSPRVAYVDLLTGAEFTEDVRHSPYVRRVYGYDADTGTVAPGLGPAGYDLVVDLHTRGVPLDPRAEAVLAGLRGRHRTGYASPYAPAGDTHRLPARQRTEHAVEYYARAVTDLLDRPPGAGRLDIDPGIRSRMAERLGPRPVCLAPGARYPWKRWPAAGYAELAERLAEKGFTPVVLGHPFDLPYVREVTRRIPAGATELIGETRELAVAMAASGTLVANNSGLAALGSAAGARVVCLHSHTLPAMWRPWGDGHANLVGDPARMPCACTGAAPHDLATPCGLGIPVPEVLDAVLGLAPGRPVRRRSTVERPGPVLARAPLRISFAGGGTDIMPYAGEYGGCVLSATVQMFATASVRPDRDDGGRPPDPAAAIAGRLLGLPPSAARTGRVHDNPNAGSGLGTSSAAMVALLAALATAHRRPRSSGELARLAYRIEREELAQTGGAQDQYAAAYGGLNVIEFQAGGVARVTPLRLPPGTLRRLEDSLLLCDTGTRRDSATVLRGQVDAVSRHRPASIDALHRMKALALDMRDRLVSGDLTGFGELMGQAWEQKQRLRPVPESPRLFETARRAGATSGKTLGAGGGGFLLFFVPPERRATVADALRSAGARMRAVRLCHTGVRASRLDRERGPG